LDDFRSIIVIPGKPVKVISNPTQYPLIGKGLQGAVFQLTNNQCVKIYSRKKYCKREANVLKQISDQTTIVPAVFEYGENYIIMEYISGKSLEDLIKESGSISIYVSEQIIHLLKELERLNFPRIDFSPRHCIYDHHGSLKLIDHVNSFKVKREYPKRLLKDLKQLKVLPEFLENVKKIAPDLHQKWQINR
jgi:RIO-like serine/threonine protein kinase